MASDRFVSRGGDKLQAAIENWKIDIKDLTCLDVGSSTGGFVDCLLQNKADKIYSVDTAYGELAWTLRNNPKVRVLERTNILHLDSLPELVDLITVDAGWTRLELVLPTVKKFLKSGGSIIALLKPHYETKNQRGNLVRGVVPEELLLGIKEESLSKIRELGFIIEAEMESPILGGGGNKEFLLYLKIK